MFIFKPLSIEDRDIFKKYLSINKFYNSEYNFTTLAAWQIVYQLEYTIVEDCLCVKGRFKDTEYVYFPLGEKENMKKAILALIDYFKSKNKPLVLMSLSDKMLELLSEFGMEALFTKELRRDFFDYVYQREKFTTLAGKKLHGKKNHFNYFMSHYEYRFVPITSENELECREKLKALITERSQNPGEELNATMMVLRYRDELQLTGRCLYVGDELTGVILGECHHGMTVVQIAKSDIRYRGASVALFNLFLSENFPDCGYVNLMDDVGLEGLRSAKLSYCPDFMIEKSILTLKGE